MSLATNFWLIPLHETIQCHSLLQLPQVRSVTVFYLSTLSLYKTVSLTHHSLSLENVKIIAILVFLCTAILEMKLAIAHRRSRDIVYDGIASWVQM